MCRTVGKFLCYNYLTQISLQKEADLEEESDDGYWDGIKYFTCTPNRGIFVDITKLLPYTEVRPKQLPEGNYPFAYNCTSKMQT